MRPRDKVVKKHRGQAPVIGFPAQPKGLQESSRWSESAETTGKVVRHDRTPKGCQTSEQVVLVKFDTRRVAKISIQVTTQKIATSNVLAPLRGATQLRIPFPVVSADSDHRLLSWQPFGLRSGESTRRKRQWGFSSPHFAFFDSMSLQLVIPWRVALQQSPSPLHQPAAL